jgi:co-chaperonin GroES (HSP10)
LSTLNVGERKTQMQVLNKYVHCVGIDEQPVKSTLVVIDNSLKDNCRFFKIIDVGPDVSDAIQGDVVVFDITKAEKFVYQKEDHYVISEDEIIGIID